jgi:hypothetical protein
MATFEFSPRRLILAGGFAVAVAAAPAFAVFTVPAAHSDVAACPSGEEEDLFTGSCVPHTVPNSPAFAPIAGNNALPSVNLPGGGGSIPCTGANTGQCIGIAESEEGQASAAPESSIGSSPTVYGETG